MKVLATARLKLLPSFFINVSAGYFLLAASVPGFFRIKSVDDFSLFLFNLIFATIYFELAVKGENLNKNG